MSGPPGRRGAPSTRRAGSGRRACRTCRTTPRRWDPSRERILEVNGRRRCYSPRGREPPERRESAVELAPYPATGGESPGAAVPLQFKYSERVPRASTWLANQNPARRNPLEGLGFGCGLGTKRQGTPLTSDASNRRKGVSSFLMTEPKLSRLARGYGAAAGPRRLEGPVRSAGPPLKLPGVASGNPRVKSRVAKRLPRW
jgi:hypothetical protein